MSCRTWAVQGKGAGQWRSLLSEPCSLPSPTREDETLPHSITKTRLFHTPGRNKQTQETHWALTFRDMIKASKKGRLTSTLDIDTPSSRRCAFCSAVNTNLGSTIENTTSQDRGEGSNKFVINIHLRYCSQFSSAQAGRFLAGVENEFCRKHSGCEVRAVSQGEKAGFRVEVLMCPIPIVISRTNTVHRCTESQMKPHKRPPAP